jgi:PAS domain S-box-containing protein
VQLLNSLARTIAQDLDLGRIAQAVTDIAVQASGAKFGIMLRNVAGDHGQTRLVQAATPSGSSDHLVIAPDSALCCATLRDGKVVRSDDIRSDARCAGAPPACVMSDSRVDIASYLAVPIMRLDKLHGALFLGHPEPDVFAQDAEDAVAGIAAHAAVAIDNAGSSQAERRLAAIIESTADAIVSKDVNGIVTSWNQGAERLFGYTDAEMIGKSITVVIPPDRLDEESEILRRIRRGERIEHYETVRMRKDGTLIDISLCVSPLKDVQGRIIGASKIARDITERKQAQARQDLLVRELHHRTKNLFAVVHAVVSRSFAGKSSVEEAQTAVLDRLHSLAQTHLLLLEQSWRGADLGEVVRSEVAPYTGRVEVEGPRVVLRTQSAQNFALALHELATNAAKYGALSARGGQVRITWSVSKSEGGHRFVFRWEESGGPPVVVPQARGFGSTVLEHVMAEYFDVPPVIQFAPSGVTYELRGALETIAEQPASC